MEKVRINLKFRIGQLVLEIIVGLILLILISMISITLLNSCKIITSSYIFESLNIEYLKNVKDHNEISEYLDEFGLTYVIFDKSNIIKSKNINTSNLILSKEAYKKHSSINTTSEKFNFLKNKSGSSIVIRVPLVPEFTDSTLNQKYNFNKLYNNLMIILSCIFVIIPFIRLSKQLRKEFLILEKNIKSSELNKIDSKNALKISEFIESVELVNDMKSKLSILIENEKQEKEDLLFQIASLSHDIKTPLSIIKGNLGMLDYADTIEEKMECLNFINKGIDSIEKYVDLFLLTTKNIYSPDIKDEILLSKLIDDINTLSKSYNSDKKQIDLLILTKSQTIFCSYMNVQRALNNIITNAIDYAKSKISITLDENKSFFIFKVYNDGESINIDTAKNIGKLFYTQDKGRNNSKHYGLGLYFANIIATSHNGSLNYRNLDEGVEFIFTIKK